MKGMNIFMLNYIWGIMIVLGIVISILTGRIEQVSQSIIVSSKEAVELAFTMLGIVTTWIGIMKIAEKGGIINKLSNKMEYVLRFLFPYIPKDHKANKYISINMIANILGLSWAATPSGLMAMQELQKLNKNKDTASDSMCMFLIINISSLQLISVNTIAYRTKYGASEATDIILPTLISTAISTLTGVIYAKFKEKNKNNS